MQTSRFHNQMTLRLTLTVPDSLLTALSSWASLGIWEPAAVRTKSPDCKVSLLFILNNRINSGCPPALSVTTSQGSVSLSWSKKHPQRGIFTSSRRNACRWKWTIVLCRLSITSPFPESHMCLKHSSSPKFRRTNWLYNTTWHLCINLLTAEPVHRYFSLDPHNNPLKGEGVIIIIIMILKMSKLRLRNFKWLLPKSPIVGSWVWFLSPDSLCALFIPSRVQI